MRGCGCERGDDVLFAGAGAGGQSVADARDDGDPVDDGVAIDGGSGGTGIAREEGRAVGLGVASGEMF